MTTEEILASIEAALTPVSDKVFPILFASWPYAWYIGNSVSEGIFIYDTYGGSFRIIPSWGDSSSNYVLEKTAAWIQSNYPYLYAAWNTMRTGTPVGGDVPGITCSMQKVLCYFDLGTGLSTLLAYSLKSDTVDLGVRYARGDNLTGLLWSYIVDGGMGGVFI